MASSRELPAMPPLQNSTAAPELLQPSSSSSTLFFNPLLLCVEVEEDTNPLSEEEDIFQSSFHSFIFPGFTPDFLQLSAAFSGYLAHIFIFP